jgi:hypothetical protein
MVKWYNAWTTFFEQDEVEKRRDDEKKWIQETACDGIGGGHDGRNVKRMCRNGRQFKHLRAEHGKHTDDRICV